MHDLETTFKQFYTYRILIKVLSGMSAKLIMWGVGYSLDKFGVA